MINTLTKIIAVTATTFAFLALSTVAKAADPIRIPVLNWSSQIVMANVLGQVFEEQGYTVEYVPAESASRYEAVRIGDLHIAHETWESTMALPFYEAMDKGGLIDAGTHDLITFEEMGFPDWILDTDLCPGLPSWEALKNADCAKNFVTPDSEGKGRMLEGPQTWHGDLIPQRIDALGLGDLWVVKFAGSADALWAELAAAEKEGRGTIIFNWTPNFTDGAGFTFIDFPPYTDGCRPVDGGDGKCGSPDGYLKKAVNENWPKTHPEAAAMFKKLSFTTGQIGAMAAYVDIDKMTHQDAAKQWLKKNKKVWKKFTK